MKREECFSFKTNMSLKISLLSILISWASVCLDGSAPNGFVSLFNGINLDGWWGAKTEDPEKWMALSSQQFREKHKSSKENITRHWSVVNGELVNDGNGLYLTTEKNYGNFELRLEYNTVAGADSGIYLRGVPQIQIWDTTKEGNKWELGADKGSGGLWNNGPAGTPGRDPLIHADYPFGQWNYFQILMIDSRVTVYLNNKLVVDDAILTNYWDRKTPAPKRKPLIKKGPIQLQTHGGMIRWRNLFIKEFPTKLSDSTDAEEYVPVFNGKDFSGWKGSLSNYEIIDNAIQCKKGKGGTIYTEKKYRDFSVMLNFMLPEGGNNGLAIRYPGKGNPAYHGMCELQILDNNHPRYATLDPRQYHGSAYGMVPAKRDFLKSTGEWNSQLVTVKGTRINVILNDQLILDADLSKVESFMGNKSHPGLTLVEGHFGFAGHKDPVAFRNIRIKEHN